MQSVRVLIAVAGLLIASGITAARAQSVQNYLSEAKGLEDRHDYDAAIKVYQQALHALPNQPELLKRLGIAYQTQLKFTESMEAFQDVLRLDPRYPEVNFYLGVSYLGYNEYNKALECFNQELRFHPEYRRARLYAAKTLLALGKEGEAIQQYQALVNQDPNDGRVWFEMASLYRSLALHAYKKLEGIDPDSVMLQILRAEADSDDLRYEDAVKRYRQALKKQPDFPGLHFALGEVYFKMDKPAEAEPELRLALREDAGNPPANYMLGQILLRDKRPTDALPFLQAAQQGDPTFMRAHLELGKCYLELGNVAQAEQALTRAAESDPHAPEPHVLLVQVYTRLNNAEKRKSELALVEKLEHESQQKVQVAVENAGRKK